MSVGLMLGPPIFGLAVDTTGSYDAGFAFLTIALACAGVLSWTWTTSGARVLQAVGLRG
jgi:hypothetical protein